MNFRSLFHSSASIRFALFLGRVMPARFGFWLAGVVGSRMAADRSSRLVRGLRANLSIASGLDPLSEQMDGMVEQTLRSHVGRLFEFYHYINNPAEIERRIRFSPNVQALIRDWTTRPFGVLIMGVHLSAFDLGMLALARQGLKILALSVPNPTGQYSKQNEIREDHGLEVAPISVSSLQLARQRLQEGGMVMTGLDRPAPESNYRPLFFGKPSQLPVFYTRLALKTGVTVIVVAVRDLPDGTHLIDCSEPLRMETRGEPREEIIYNTERVLTVAEEFIKGNLEQWAMFFPVWPEINEES